MSHLGTAGAAVPAASVRSGTRWCFPASLLAACTSSSQATQSAASSAQHSTRASAAPHALHWIFIPGWLPARVLEGGDGDEDGGEARGRGGRDWIGSRLPLSLSLSLPQPNKRNYAKRLLNS